MAKEEVEAEAEVESKPKQEVNVVVEDKDEKVESWRPRTQLEFILMVVLALVVGFLIGYFIYKFLKDRYEPEYREEPFFYYPHIPFAPREEPKVIAHPSPEKPRRSAIDIEAIRRTPESLRRNGIYLDKDGEACLTGDTMYETWSIQKNMQGEIIDAYRVDEEEFEMDS